MLQSSLSKLASQFKPSSGGQGESVSTQNVASDQEENPSDQDDHSEGENVNSEGDPADTQGISRLDSLRMTEEEERVFNTFSLAPVTVPKRSLRAHEDSKDLRSQDRYSPIRDQTRLEISPGLACESGSLSSPGVPRSWSRSRPTSCGSE